MDLQQKLAESQQSINKQLDDKVTGFIRLAKCENTTSVSDSNKETKSVDNEKENASKANETSASLAALVPSNITHMVQNQQTFVGANGQQFGMMLVKMGQIL